MPWSCAICGRGFEAVDRWRRRRGLSTLMVSAVLCGRDDCKRAYSERYREKRNAYFRVRYARARHNRRPQRPRGAWRCAICGMGLEDAMAMRRRRRCRQVSPKPFATCSPECSRAWKLRYSRMLFRGTASRIS